MLTELKFRDRTDTITSNTNSAEVNIESSLEELHNLLSQYNTILEEAVNIENEQLMIVNKIKKQRLQIIILEMRITI